MFFRDWNIFETILKISGYNLGMDESSAAFVVWWGAEQSTVAGDIKGIGGGGGSKEGGAAYVINAAFVLKVIYLAIGLFGFFSNIFVVVVIFLHKPMHKQLTNILIMNQGIMDAIVAFFLFFASLFEDDDRVRKTQGLARDEALCRVWYTKLPMWSLLIASTYGIVAMTFERFLAVVHPIWHKTTFTRSRTMTRLTLALPWVIGPTWNASYMIATAMVTADGQCTVYTWPNRDAQMGFGALIFFVQYLFPLSLLAVGYSCMAWVLHKRVDAGAEGGGGGGGGGKRNESMARARGNVFKTLFLVALSFIVCWTCNQVYYLMYNFGYPYIDYSSTFYNFTVIMVLVNCCVNPVIYSVKYKAFQRGVTVAFCRHKVRPMDDHGHGPASNVTSLQ